MANPVDPELDRIDLQNAEFDAMTRLAQHYSRLCATAVVDDDYPEVRHDYESALKTFLEACAANGRTMSPKGMN